MVGPKDSSLTEKFKSLDFYKKLPEGVSESTCSGAIISIGCAILMIVLFITEFNSYRQVDVQSEIFIDDLVASETLTIRFDIDFYALPCTVISLDSVDMLGTGKHNVLHEIERKRLNSGGATISIFRPTSERPDVKLTKEMLNNKEGCKMSGQLNVLKVPGNMHFSTHGFQDVVAGIGGSDKLNMSHRVNNFQFGKRANIAQIKRKFQETDAQHSPISNTTMIRTDTNLTVFNYYLNIVPTIYIDLNGRVHSSDQFTASSDSVHLHEATGNAVYFKYEIAPIYVRYSMTKRSFIHFLVQVCAIIGGIFTVAGLIDSIVKTFFAAIFKAFD